MRRSLHMIVDMTKTGLPLVISMKDTTPTAARAKAKNVPVNAGKKNREQAVSPTQTKLKAPGTQGSVNLNATETSKTGQTNPAPKQPSVDLYTEGEYKGPLVDGVREGQVSGQCQ